MGRYLYNAVFYQLVIFLRIKQAVFFTLIFPVFLFVIFGNIWGKSDVWYIEFIFFGVLAITVTSDGLYAIGPVIKEYYSNGLIKYLNKMPQSVLTHFVGLIISRVFVLISIFLVLILTAFFVFGYAITLTKVLSGLALIIIGLFIFSFMGLALSFANIKHKADKGIAGFVYYILLFTSDAFYPVGEFNSTIKTIGNLLPLNPLLQIAREGTFSPLVLAFWLIFPVCIFYYFYKKSDITR